MPGFSISNLPPEEQQLLQSWGVRDFSETLRDLSPDRLKTLFHHDSKGRVDLQALLYNFIWQGYTEIRSGKRDLKKRTNDNLRSFWYSDLKTSLALLGLFQGSLLEDLAWEEFSEEEDPDTPPRVSTSFYLYDQMTRSFDHYVRNHIFRFRDFQFSDENQDLHCLGTERPEVIFAAEKAGFKGIALEIHQTYGCNTICLGGQPKLISSEYFCEELGQGIDLGSKEFVILAWVDYDPAGAILADRFQEQLRFFGMKHSRVESLFTLKILREDQIKRKYPLSHNSKSRETINQRWVEKTGGINGEPYGLESDVVDRDQLFSCVDQAFQKLGGSHGKTQYQSSR